jgi:hypothetical protein
MSQWTSILRRHGVLPILGSALIGILGIGASGLATQVAQSSVHDPDYPPPYDNSKADRALKAFDDEHPKCALWTDWHKLCSRTGPKGSTYCRIDSGHPTAPSTPFCARSLGHVEHNARNLIDEARSSEETKSIKRFSKKVQAPCNSDGCGGFVIVYDAKRPFNGTSLRTWDHPYCASWEIENDLGNQETQTCSKNGKNGTLLCSSPRISSARIHDPDQIRCTQTISRRDCSNAPKNPSASEIVAGNAVLLDKMPVWGHYCN